jgi:hypothetical protein
MKTKNQLKNNFTMYTYTKINNQRKKIPKIDENNFNLK